MSVVEQWIQEDYFTSLCLVLDNIDYPQAEIEEQAHRVLDTYTTNGVLNQEEVDRYIDYLCGIEQ